MKQTNKEFFKKLVTQNHSMKFGVDKKETCVAVMSGDRFIPVLCKTIDGAWYPYQPILANGVNPYNGMEFTTIEA